MVVVAMGIRTGVRMGMEEMRRQLSSKYYDIHYIHFVEIHVIYILDISRYLQIYA
jgi:hypothetical protein